MDVGVSPERGKIYRVGEVQEGERLGIGSPSVPGGFSEWAFRLVHPHKIGILEVPVKDVLY